MQIKNNLIKIIKLVTKNFIIFLRMIFGLFFVIGFSVSAVEFILYMSQADWRVGLFLDYSGCRRSNVRPTPYGLEALPHRPTENPQLMSS